MSGLPARVIGGRADPANVERLLRALPEWFGLEDSLLGYVAEAGTLPGYLAYVESDSAAVGVLLLKRHFPHAAEVHLMAVTPGLHRRGVGGALLAAAEADLRSDGVRLLQVKTLGPSRPEEAYRRTLAFYRAQGFIPMEEIDGLWPGNPCLILVKCLSG